MRYSAGTSNTVGAAGLAAALECLTAKAVSTCLGRLQQQLVEGLSAMPAVRVVGHGALGLVSCCLDGQDPHETAWILESGFNIRCRGGLHCSPRMHVHLSTYPHGTLRFSLSGMSQDDDVKAALEAVACISVGL